ncbi:MAG: CRTAC1 family protein [Thermoplasmatota archaeon]
MRADARSRAPRAASPSISTLGAFAPFLFALVALVATAGLASAHLTTYRDVASAAGVAEKHVSQSTWYKFVEVTGSGTCWGDFDGDGFPDLYEVNQRYWNATLEAQYHPTSHMFRNNGDGTFTDVTTSAGVAYDGWGTGCAVADYNGDGYPDLFVTGYGSSTLYRNNGDWTFTNVTAAAGVTTDGACPHGFPCWSMGASFEDTNGDGCLDLYIPNYVEYKMSDDKGQGPGLYDGQDNLYFQNNCDGTFTDRSAASGLNDPAGPNHGKDFQSSWADFNGDGRPDVFLAPDTVPASLYENNGDGTFTNVATAAGVDDPRANMGLVFNDVNGDGTPDLYITHYTQQNNGFYVNNRDSTFTDRSGEGNLSDDLAKVGWGTSFLDYDNDGYTDIVVVDGHSTQSPQVGDNKEERMLFRHMPGRLEFQNVTYDAGLALDRHNSRGLALADYDRDGTVDLGVENTANDTYSLYHGEGATGRWLEIDLREGAPNVFAVGARVSVTLPNGVTATSLVQSGQSFLSQNEYVQHFGLANFTSANVTIDWPDGATQSFLDLAANETVRLTKGSSAVETDTIGPKVTVTADEPGKAGWFARAPNLTLTATDRGVTTISGVASIEYRVDDGAWQTYTATVVMPAGDHDFEYRATDNAGNPSGVSVLHVRIDNTPPVTSASASGTVGNGGWFVSPVNVSFSATDDRSGIDATYATLDAPGDPTTPAPAAGLAVVTDGVHAVRYRSVDLAQNVEGTRELDVAIDTTPPVTSIGYNGSFVVEEDGVHIMTATAITLFPNDATSGLAATEYRIDGGDWSAYTAPIHLAGADGAHTLEYRSTDNAGNVEATHLAHLVLDNVTPPPIHVIAPVPGSAYAAGASAHDDALDPLGALVVGELHVTAFAGPDVQGVAWTAVALDGVERARVVGGVLDWDWMSTSEPPGPHTLTITSSDGGGHVGSVSVPVFVGGVGGV